MAITSGGVTDQYVNKRTQTRVAPIVPRNSFLRDMQNAAQPNAGFANAGAEQALMDQYVASVSGGVTAPGGAVGSASGGYTAPAPVVASDPRVGLNQGDPNNPRVDIPLDGNIDPNKTFDPQDALSEFAAADIEAALLAIEAEFGLTREQLLADQTMIGAEYRLLTAQLGRQKQLALEGAEAGALQRGLFRSGVYASQVGDVQKEYTDIQAQYASETEAKAAPGSAQLATLEADKAAAKAQAEADIRRREYEARLLGAGI